MERPIIYDRLWTEECISRLKKEKSEAERIEKLLKDSRNSIPPEAAPELARIVKKVQILENSIGATANAMEGYISNMEAAMRAVEAKIKEAADAGAQILQTTE